MGNQPVIKEVTIEELSTMVEGNDPIEVVDIGIASVSRYKGTVSGDFLHVSGANGRQLVIKV